MSFRTLKRHRRNNFVLKRIGLDKRRLGKKLFLDRKMAQGRQRSTTDAGYNKPGENEKNRKRLQKARRI